MHKVTTYTLGDQTKGVVRAPLEIGLSTSCIHTKQTLATQFAAADSPVFVQVVELLECLYSAILWHRVYRGEWDPTLFYLSY